MGAKVRKIVMPTKSTATDENRLKPEAFEAVRLDLASKLGGNVNFAVKAVADFFTPRKLGEVTAEEIRANLDQIVAKTKTGQASSDIRERMPEDDTVRDWNAGLWNGQLTIRGLEEEYPEGDLTRVRIVAYIEKLKAEEKAKKELTDERSDPKSEPVSCVFALHREDTERKFQPTTRFRITRGTNGWERQRHPRGNELIRVGNFYVPPTENGEEPRVDAYCAACRELAWKMARENVDADGKQNPFKLTFHDREGADRKVAAILESSQKRGAAADQLGLNVKRHGQYIPKAMRAGGWRTQRPRFRGSR